MSRSPAIILVRPQLGMNIGMAARAMANFELDQLRLVAPRDGWPNPDAGPAAAGADAILDRAQVHDRVADALADCQWVLATTVRPRGVTKPVLTPREAAAGLRAAAERGEQAGILFGPERSGLETDDMATANAIVTCPVSPRFGSLNLAQAVLLLAYEWFQAAAPAVPVVPAPVPAPHADLAGLIAQLEECLEAAGWFHPPERAPAARRTIAAMLSRPGFTAEEVRTLRGIVRALAESRQRPAGMV